MLKISKIGNITEITFDNIQKLNIIISEKIKTEIHKVFIEPNMKVLINMKGIEYLDSSGFAAFLSISKAALKNNGQIIFCNLSSSAFEFFKALNLHNVFKIINDHSEAVKSFE